MLKYFLFFVLTLSVQQAFHSQNSCPWFSNVSMLSSHKVNTLLAGSWFQGSPGDVKTHRCSNLLIKQLKFAYTVHLHPYSLNDLWLLRLFSTLPVHHFMNVNSNSIFCFWDLPATFSQLISIWSWMNQEMGTQRCRLPSCVTRVCHIRTNEVAEIQKLTQLWNKWPFFYKRSM